jgi:uncharacterized membrane protein YccC
MSRLDAIFKLNRKGLNVPRGLGVVVVMLVPLVVLGLLDLEKYYIALAFGLLFVALSDPGGEYKFRVQEMAIVAVIGALLTALGYAIAQQPWGWVVLATFVVTLLSGLAIKFGTHRFVAGILLNSWFLIVIAMPSAYKLDHVSTTTGAQTLAWVVGAAIWIALTLIWWLARGRKPQPSHVPEIPADTTGRALTKPVILFAVIRGVALAIPVAIAFGLHVPNADWMPIATLVAMKPSLGQSILVAEQRLAGALIGAVLAALMLVAVTDKYALTLVMLIFAGLAASMRTVNYAIYTACVAALVLIAEDIPHPSDFATEARRVLFTLIGLGIGVAVMFLANLLQKRSAPAAAAAT